MKKKILFFSMSKRELSGGQTMIFNALKKINRTIYDVELIVQSECPLSIKVKSEGIPVHFLPMPNFNNKKGEKNRIVSL
ncbi:hypothetical protein, partial [Peribacillus simplex]|uniref:hypothetical protein n=1 Tax=Peribacillus simplex TaxID=1478 RepID=UPI000BDBDBAE